MLSFRSYLYFNGNCEQAFEFYRSVFGGEFEVMSRFSEMPDNLEFSIAEQDHNKIMHATLLLNEGQVLMGCDSLDAKVSGNNSAISISLNDEAHAKKLFDGLSEQGQVTMPMAKTFWGSYFGMLTDQFGMQWMVNCELDDHT